MRSFVLVAAIFVSACTAHAVTPGARSPLVMDSPRTPDPGKTDLQLDAATTGEIIWGPNLYSGGGRVRRTVAPGYTIEGDAGLLHVTNPGSGGDRNGYTGRVGLVASSADHTAALTAGLGGGYSPVAGSWGSGDVGGMLSGSHRYVRPVLSGNVGYSAPLASHRTFTVTEPDDGEIALRLPRNIFFQIHCGLELGRPDAVFLVGMSVSDFTLLDSSVVDNGDVNHHMNQLYGTLGLGARFVLD